MHHLRLRPALMVLLTAAMMGPGPLESQSAPIVWTVHTNEALVQEGRPFPVLVHARIPQGTHLYSLTQPPGGPMAARITADSTGVFTITGPVSARAPDRARDPSFNFATETYSDSVTFTLSVVAQASGVQTLSLAVHYQSCTDRLCLPAQRASLRLPLSIARGSLMSAPGYSLLPVPPRSARDSSAADSSAREAEPALPATATATSRRPTWWWPVGALTVLALALASFRVAQRRRR